MGYEQRRGIAHARMFDLPPWPMGLIYCLYSPRLLVRISLRGNCPVSMSVKMITLNYPIRQSIAFSNTLLKLYYLARSTDCEEVTFDLRKTKSITPFGIMLLASTIIECLRSGRKCIYRRPIDSKMQAFFKEIGFNKFFKLKDSDYNDLYNIESGILQLRKRTGLDTLLIEDLIEIMDYHLVMSSGVKESLKMSLQEAIINVVDHSGVFEYYICCWKYPEKKQLRLCIADLGIGIPNSLRNVPTYSKIKDDHEAIKKATEEGVSTRNSKAGLGLSHIKKFLNVNKGQLCIISSQGKVFWKYDQEKILKQRMVQPFDGTIIKIIVNTANEGYYFLTEENNYLF